ncbi:MAG: hypothetical protein J6A22_02370 [Bacteroidales bacterium]|nr:hypothetical protein [Bacteroidales bacterium]
MTTTDKSRKTASLATKIGRIFIWTASIWFAILILLQIVLSPSLLTGILNKAAKDFIDGDIRFGKAGVSLFRDFPNISLNLDDFTLTYPADRFDNSESMGAQGWLAAHGTGERSDTLASLKSLSVSLRVFPLIFGAIDIPEISLTSPRIYAHSYADGRTNWQIFKTSEGKEAEEDASDQTDGLPEIRLRKISLEEHPHIVYTDSRDTVFAMIDMKDMEFRGRINTSRVHAIKGDFSLDSLFAAGRIANDTIALGIDRININDKGRRRFDASLEANTTLATRSFGRLRIPIEIGTSIIFHRDSIPSVSLEGFRSSIAYIPLEANMDLSFHTDHLGINGDFGIEGWKADDAIKEYAANFIPELKRVKTDATITLDGHCNGSYSYDGKELPEISIYLDIPESSVKHEDFSEAINLTLKMSAETECEGNVRASITDAAITSKGLDIRIIGDAEELLDSDPVIRLDCSMSFCLDSLVSVLPDSLQIQAAGSLEAMAKGSFKMSQLSLYNMTGADIQAEIKSDRLSVDSPLDTLGVRIKGFDIKLAPETMTSRKDSTRQFNLIGVTVSIDSTHIKYKDALEITGERLKASAKNNIDPKDTSEINPLGGRISADLLIIKDASDAQIRLSGSNNGFQLMPKRTNRHVPVLTLNSSNKNLIVRDISSRAVLNDVNIRANAAMNSIERRQKIKALRDSLAEVYPEIPEDSLLRHAWAQKAKAPRDSKVVPEWLKEDDFRAKDIDIRLDKSLAKYFREWDINGNFSLSSGILQTRYFPLMNLLRSFEASFNNDKVAIDTLLFQSGSSNLGVRGSLTGLKRALLGRGDLKLDAEINSSRLNTNELLRAYDVGSKYLSISKSAKAATVSDSELMKMAADTTSDPTLEMPLIIVPSNLNADIGINAKNMIYSKLAIQKFDADIVMKERCVQIKNAKAATNMGGIELEAFYATRSKKNLKTGICLDFKDITAERVISLVPAIDTIMPLLKTFNGLLDCEFAVTSDLDTNMNLVMPSINGIARISGKDLTIQENDIFRKFARLLLFKNRKEGRVDQMTVEGVIKDNKIEVFPFILKMDRYTLALSGIQNFDQSFLYHASLIRSPFLIKLGVDIQGNNFDDMGFRIGKAKYRNTEVPVFTAVIDQTKINLRNSITDIFKKGVNAAIEENTSQKILLEHKKKLGYLNVAEDRMEELSEDEMKQFEAEKAARETEEAGEVDENEETTEKDI